MLATSIGLLAIPAVISLLSGSTSGPDGAFATFDPSHLAFAAAHNATGTEQIPVNVALPVGPQNATQVTEILNQLNVQVSDAELNHLLTNKTAWLAFAHEKIPAAISSYFFHMPSANALASDFSHMLNLVGPNLTGAQLDSHTMKLLAEYSGYSENALRNANASQIVYASKEAMSQMVERYDPVELKIAVGASVVTLIGLGTHWILKK